MRISDWSSDVCSSDLREDVVDLPGVGDLLAQRAVGNAFAKAVAQGDEGRIVLGAGHLAQHLPLGIRTAPQSLGLARGGYEAARPREVARRTVFVEVVAECGDRPRGP